MMTVNLNPWYAVAYRKLNQLVRRQYYKLNKPARDRLWRERMHLAGQRTLDDTSMARLRSIAWKMGSGSVYRFTPEQEREQVELARRIVRDLKNH